MSQNQLMMQSSVCDKNLAFIIIYLFFWSVWCHLLPLQKGRGFGPVVRAVGWHAGDPGLIPGKDNLYTCFGRDLSLYKNPPFICVFQVPPA
jgi:hypothetical protein